MRVLDTLRVTPLDPATTTTTATAPPPTITTITIPATTAAPFVPVSDDEQQIANVFTIWMDDQSDSSLDQSVENPDAVRAPSHEGWNQHSPDDLAQYEGRVESIRVLDANRAEVVYTILHAGQVQFDHRLGSAVRVNGEWKVSTETVCSMLAIGGIRCPA